MRQRSKCLPGKSRNAFNIARRLKKRGQTKLKQPLFGTFNDYKFKLETSMRKKHYTKNLPGCWNSFTVSSSQSKYWCSFSSNSRISMSNAAKVENKNITLRLWKIYKNCLTFFFFNLHLKILDGSSNPIFVYSIHGGVVDRVFSWYREVQLF